MTESPPVPIDPPAQLELDADAGPDTAQDDLVHAVIPLLLFAIGAGVLVLPAAWRRTAEHGLLSQTSLAIVGAALILAGGIWLLKFAQNRPDGDSTHDYYIHTTITGLALTAASMIALSGIAGMVFHGTIQLEYLAKSLDAVVRDRDGWAEAVHVMSAGGLSLVGVTFFIAHAVRQSVKTEDFHRGKFWTGMLFRIGEAVIFTLVFVLIGSFQVAQQQEPLIHYKVLPVLGLFMGMFVKTGETVIFGLAAAVFEMAQRALPTRRVNDQKSGRAGDEMKAAPAPTDQPALDLVDAPPSLAAAGRAATKDGENSPSAANDRQVVAQA